MQTQCTVIIPSKLPPESFDASFGADGEDLEEVKI